MGVKADFGISGWLFQADGTQLSWDITWPGVIDYRRFVAVAFQGDYRNSQLVRVSESFTSDDNENEHVGEVIRCHGEFGGTAFRFQVVVIPSH